MPSTLENLDKLLVPGFDLVYLFVGSKPVDERFLSAFQINKKNLKIYVYIPSPHEMISNIG